MTIPNVLVASGVGLTSLTRDGGYGTLPPVPRAGQPGRRDAIIAGIAVLLAVAVLLGGAVSIDGSATAGRVTVPTNDRHDETVALAAFGAL